MTRPKKYNEKTCVISVRIPISWKKKLPKNDISGYVAKLIEENLKEKNDL